jgi:polysaccharide export outer membrane protein
MTRITSFAGLLLLAGLLSSLSGCAWAPGHRLTGSDLGQPPAAGLEQTAAIPPLIPITAELVARQQAERLRRTGEPLAPPPAHQAYQDYIIGPGDILAVTVWDHPELTIPAGEFRSPELAGSLVDARGRIFYPYVGEIEVAGLNVAQVRALLAERLSLNIRNPQVDLRVAAFRSKKVLITGEVKTPNVIALTDRPLTLLEAINLAGGPTPLADLREVRLSRAGSVSRVDLLALYQDGTPNPIILQPDDQVYVSDNLNNTVYVLGEVSKPMVVPMIHKRLTLADALGAGGGISADNADAGQIFVIRNEAGQAKVYQLDGNSADSLLLATTFDLERHDVIYVAPTGLTVWNRIVGKILPTVQTIWQTQNLIDRWSD